MPEIQLTPKERQALKARAHGLKPVVLLGNAGLSPPVLKEIDRALTAHELIKVKVPGDDRAERDELFAERGRSSVGRARPGDREALRHVPPAARGNRGSSVTFEHE